MAVEGRSGYDRGMLDPAAHLARVLENLVHRVHGPMKFRFVFQPITASVLAIRAGLGDAREGRPPYFWSVLVDAEHRRELLRGGWKDIARLLVFIVILDVVFQLYVLRWVYPLEAVIIALVLGVVPYLFLRGPVNRVARLMGRGSASR